SVTKILDPEFPSGCPKETAPPFTLILAESNPKICVLTIPTTENASLNSQKSTSEVLRLALAKATGTALAGAVVKNSGSWAASPYERIFAKGFNPNSSAFSLDIKTKAEAPSFKVEALAAVTVPSFSKAGRNSGNFAKFADLYSSSSLIKIGSPFL